MRKVFGLILLGLGGFLLMAAILALVWAPGAVKKTPTDVDTTTYLSGTAQKLDPTTNELVSSDIKVTSITRADSNKSDGDTVVWTATSCVVANDDGNTPDCVDGDDPRLISASTDVFATDRVTAIAVPDFKGLPPDAVPHEGLVNKWPFDAQKKTYPYWDGTLGKTVDAVYDGSDTLNGVDVYRYKITVKDQPIEIADGINGTYDNAGEIWVEPKTGAILNQSQDQQRYLEDGSTVLDLQAEFTPEQQKISAADSKDSLSQLNLILRVVPIVGFVGGVLCILGGLALLLTGRRSTGSGTPGKREMTPAGA